jgi:hypothetical protein
MDSRGTVAMARAGLAPGSAAPPQQGGAFFMYMGLPSKDVLSSIAQNGPVLTHAEPTLVSSHHSHGGGMNFASRPSLQGLGVGGRRPSAADDYMSRVSYSQSSRASGTQSLPELAKFGGRSGNNAGGVGYHPAMANAYPALQAPSPTSTSAGLAPAPMPARDEWAREASRAELSLEQSLEPDTPGFGDAASTPGFGSDTPGFGKATPKRSEPLIARLGAVAEEPPPAGNNARPSVKDTALWVGSVPDVVDEGALTEIMSTFGEVAAICLRAKDGNRTWGFVLYKEESAARLVRSLGTLSREDCAAAVERINERRRENESMSPDKKRRHNESMPPIDDFKMQVKDPNYPNMSNADMRSMAHVWRETLKKTPEGKHIDSFRR